MLCLTNLRLASEIEAFELLSSGPQKFHNMLYTQFEMNVQKQYFILRLTFAGSLQSLCTTAHTKILSFPKRRQRVGQTRSLTLNSYASLLLTNTYAVQFPKQKYYYMVNTHCMYCSFTTCTRKISPSSAVQSRRLFTRSPPSSAYPFCTWY